MHVSKTEKWETMMDAWAGLVQSLDEELYEQCLKCFANLCVATYPSAGGRREGSRVRLPRKENARSRHQLLFEENVKKTGKLWSTKFNRERFGSCFYAQERY